MSSLKDIILISTLYLPCKQQVATSNTGPILVFPRIQPLGSDASSSLGRVYSRQATVFVNCENSSVSFVMKYCPISTTFRNPASIQKLLNWSCCDNFSIRSPFCCNRRSLRARSSQSCVRGDGVQGVLTLFCSGAAQVCHDDRVVELKEQLEVEEEDGDRQEEEVEVEREKRVKEGAPCG